MARDAQTATAGASAGTRLDFLPLLNPPEFRRAGNSPMALLTHRGNLTLDGSGAGDTADLNLALPLPIDFVWQLNSWAAVINTTADYDRGFFELPINQPGSAQGAATTMNFAVNFSDQINILAGTTVAKMILCFGTGNISPGANPTVPMDKVSPFPWLSYNLPSNPADAALLISGGAGTDLDAGALVFAFQWIGYTLEQGRSHALYTGINGRG